MKMKLRFRFGRVNALACVNGQSLIALPLPLLSNYGYLASYLPS